MNRRITALALAAIAALAAPALAQSDTAFTYQGELRENGQPASGPHDLAFSLWDALSDGNQIGSTITLDDVPVEDGLVTVELDFGADAFDNSGRWLEIDVNGVPLAPRQPITRAPYSIQTRGIFVDDDERVGIGTTEVQQFAPATIRGRGVNSDWVQFQSTAGTNDWHLSGTGGGLDFVQTGVAAHRLYLEPGGNVGIGTDLPVSRLHVDGDIRGRNIIANGFIDTNQLFAGQVFAGGILMEDDTDIEGVDEVFGFNDLRFYGDPPMNGGQGPDLRIVPNGNVGIGIVNGDPLARLHVNGNFTVTNGTKNFMVDHPLDPTMKSIAHNAVEGPDYYTFYQGSVTLNHAGEAWAGLPDYFQALNTQWQYQLTCVGGYAAVYVAEEVRDNRFKIAGGQEGLTVSWQVTGVRNDPYARDHPYQDVVEKQGAQRGRYHYPAGYGMPTETGIRDRSNDEPLPDGRDALRQ